MKKSTNPSHKMAIILVLSFCLNHLGVAQTFDQSRIPLPEHPRPDFQRPLWLNLNGPWEFQFDKDNAGLGQKWYAAPVHWTEEIMVPFSWGSKLSGVDDKADIGWYSRLITVPASWQGKRVFLVVGACDWQTTAWLDGNQLGSHQGGYTPFEFEVTPYLKNGNSQRLILRVDDTPHDFKLEGKQGYGRAAGIWQTIYLEARPEVALKTVHFSPDIDQGLVSVDVALDTPSPKDVFFGLHFKESDVNPPAVGRKIKKGETRLRFDVSIPKPRLWSLEDPYLYEVDAVLEGKNGEGDRVSTYFGMRKISVVNLPHTRYPYIALNNKPVYLQLTLDQAFHPEGYYTFPSDDFMRDELLRTRRLGLNGQRIHVKIDAPRKLYWADRLGVLIMADVPNSWGTPTPEMRREMETAMRGMIERDFNHPAIFSWVNFNETWGLQTKIKEEDGSKTRNVYKPETQEWVASIFRLTKQLDPTRLVEDNSPCNLDHVETDINSWHSYLPGTRWRGLLDEVTGKTYPGSPWNFIGNRKQGNQPLLNSECGNVWGYEGDTGDVDWSWDYHIMMNEFRRHPKVCGWLYTEHHDVINEWNGYYRFDRSEKTTGLSGIMPGMTLNDLHGPFYIASERELCRNVKPGETVTVPLYASFLTDRASGDHLILRAELAGWDNLGRRETYSMSQRTIPLKPWMSEELEPLTITMPGKPALAVLSLMVEDEVGNVLHRNFTTYLAAQGNSPREETVSDKYGKWKVIRFSPGSFSKARWSLKQWDVLDGLKVNGAGSGYFEYRLTWPAELKVEEISQASFLMEASAKQLFGKDRTSSEKTEGDFMRGEGTHDPSLNPNSYPMTDEKTFPSAVRVRVADQAIGMVDLPDDPADHRGILSWYSQKQDGRLREAGSYGYLITLPIPRELLIAASQSGEIVIRLEVEEALPGGLAVYGERFGRYPLDPTIVFVMKK
jgi:hypothetical protein